MYQVHIDLIERVQRKFMKMLTYRSRLNTSNMSYEDKVKHFKLHTLRHRRDISDVLFIVKLLESKIKCNELLSEIVMRNNTKNTINTDLFKINKWSTNIAQNSSLTRCLSICNKLANPPFIIIFDVGTHQTIKNKLTTYFAFD
uniref:Uncharacterized protein n=1 Tax=Cacopsylla melanoneura TaxID=428564 RepID=A0A8D8PUR9_9HEMI